MIPILNTGKTECTIGNNALQVGQSIDYKSATDTRTSIGRIEAFMYAGHRQENKESVWMRISDMGRDAVSEWISVTLWHSQNKSGLFGSKYNTETPAKTVAHASSEPENADEYPF